MRCRAPPTRAHALLTESGAKERAQHRRHLPAPRDQPLGVDGVQGGSGAGGVGGCEGCGGIVRGVRGRRHTRTHAHVYTRAHARTHTCTHKQAWHSFCRQVDMHTAMQEAEVSARDTPAHQHTVAVGQSAGRGSHAGGGERVQRQGAPGVGKGGGGGATPAARLLPLASTPTPTHTHTADHGRRGRRGDDQDRCGAPRRARTAAAAAPSGGGRSR